MKVATLRALLAGDLENAFIAEAPGGIEAQEAQGQKDFVASTTLPIECNFCSIEQLEQMGIMFSEPIDDLFIEARLPEGWRKVASDHPMWSYLIDEQSRRRASIFYKAAFYDKRAHIGLLCRFSYQVRPKEGWDSDFSNESPRVCVVTDCGEVIWESEPMLPSKEVEWFELGRHLNPLGETWLDNHYPDWENPLAYWEEGLPSVLKKKG